MEILNRHEGQIRFVVPSDSTSATYKIYRGTVQIGTEATATVLDGVATVAVPYAATREDGELRIELTFTSGADSYTDSKYVEVTTPCLDIHEVKNILETTDTEEAIRVEAAARHIINAHTGQSFGKYTGTFSVTGSGDSNLRMPRRLISLTSINGGTYWNDLLALRGGGWFLQSKHIYAPSIRADFDGWHYSNQSPIVAPPSRVLSTFIKHQEYEIDGVWGWESVPEPVREAARLLINDYACADSLYRDRFLTSMTAADWRIQFHDGAFSNTGNVRANQLLAEFVLRRGWVVI